MYEVRQLLQSEIELLVDLPPKEWDMNLPNIVSLHYGYPYFYPIVACKENEIIGFGNGILNNKIGWVGNIIVTPEMRRQGIGYQLTNHLVEFFKKNGCVTQLLIATELGKNIYSKIGFRTSSTYHIYKSGNGSNNYQQITSVRKVRKEDYPALRKLDMEITGEERSHLIERFFSTGLVYCCEEPSEIQGVYLPDLGSGFILAINSKAGIELMKYRFSQGKTTATIPSDNVDAIKFLEEENFQLQKILPRMVLGDKLNWKPNLIFNRGTGYFG
ncbi:MAG: GNAT family N-acetyltransferase [Ignavibacteriales bacterium]|nr:GNAT family N-acetyltransferase [Ignavibacteriales bacterium]